MRGIDALISRTDDLKQVKELEARKKRVQEEFQTAHNKTESDFVAAETRKMREITARSMDRETKAIKEMNEMHFEEKKKIFEDYLPDNLVKEVFEDIRAKDQHDMSLY